MVREWYTNYDSIKVTSNKQKSFKPKWINGKIQPTSITEFRMYLCAKHIWEDGKRHLTYKLSDFDTSQLTTFKQLFVDMPDRKPSDWYWIEDWDTSNIMNFTEMFSSCNFLPFLLNEFRKLDLSKWNTSNVTNMSYMFLYADWLLPDISQFDTSNVKTMKCMFKHTCIDELDVSKWNTSNVINMDEMFAHSDVLFWNSEYRNNKDMIHYQILSKSWSSEIEWVELSSACFDNMIFPIIKIMDANRWYDIWVQYLDVSNVETARSMFNACVWFDSDLSLWNTKNMCDVKWMFKESHYFTWKWLELWNTSKFVNTELMFSNCKRFVWKIWNWDMSNVQNADWMFNWTYLFNESLDNWRMVRYSWFWKLMFDCYWYNKFIDFQKIFPKKMKMWWEIIWTWKKRIKQWWVLQHLSSSSWYWEYLCALWTETSPHKLLYNQPFHWHCNPINKEHGDFWWHNNPVDTMNPWWHTILSEDQQWKYLKNKSLWVRTQFEFVWQPQASTFIQDCRKKEMEREEVEMLYKKTYMVWYEKKVKQMNTKNDITREKLRKEMMLKKC